MPLGALYQILERGHPPRPPTGPGPRETPPEKKGAPNHRTCGRAGGRHPTKYDLQGRVMCLPGGRAVNGSQLPDSQNVRVRSHQLVGKCGKSQSSQPPTVREPVQSKSPRTTNWLTILLNEPLTTNWPSATTNQPVCQNAQPAILPAGSNSPKVPEPPTGEI